MVANKIKFDDFPEEIEFQKLVNEYKLLDKAEYGRMSKGIANVAQKKTSENIIAIRARNSKIRDKQKFLEMQKQWSN